jgi:hypothetical protein
MIVVVGLPAYAGGPDGVGGAGGLAVDVAAAARQRGGSVELTGKVGDDGAGDAVVVALGRLGIGHAALLRDSGRPTPVIVRAGAQDRGAADAGEAVEDHTAAAIGPTAADALFADADGVEGLEPILLPEDPAERPGLEAADVELALSYLPGASVIVLADPLPEAAVQAGAQAAAYAGARLIVLVRSGESPPAAAADAIVLEAPDRDDGSFGRLVGGFASALESGLDPAAAFREAVEASGWEKVGG